MEEGGGRKGGDAPRSGTYIASSRRFDLKCVIVVFREAHVSTISGNRVRATQL